MITDTRTRILSYIKTKHQARVVDLLRHINIRNVAMHRQLKSLVQKGQLVKYGTPPKVYYQLPNSDAITENLPRHELLDKYFAYATPTGQLLTGLAAFKTWLARVHKDNQFDSLLKRFTQDRSDIGQFFTADGLIDATKNIQKIFPDKNTLDGVFYLDFYSLPTFGKSRLGTYMLYAKQSESVELMDRLLQEAKPMIDKLIVKYAIQAVAFIPPSIPRKIQFLKYFAQGLNLSLPKINLIKLYSGQVRVAQKTLGSLAERIINARDTIAIDSANIHFSNLLLIDDAVGSAATLSETAKKLKQQGIAQKVYGFAIVGSFKGFEVIREV